MVPPFWAAAAPPPPEVDELLSSLPQAATPVASVPQATATAVMR
jgi:hypothetical protein